MKYQSSTSSSVATISRATSLGTATPLDKNYVPSDLSMTVTALPPNGTVLLADGSTPVRPRQVLTLAQLEALKFRPALSSTAGSQAFGFSTTNPAGVVVDAEARLPAGYSVLSVPQDSGARTIGIQLSDTDRHASETCAIITALPSNGTLLLADGATTVTQGQTLTAAQLKRLRFRPAIDAVGQISDLSYLMIGSAGGALAGCVLLIVRPAAPPFSATAAGVPAPAGAAESSSAGAAGPAALLDTRLSSGSLSKSIRSVLRKEGRKDETLVQSSGVDTHARSRSLKVERARFSARNRRQPRRA
jgi:hypothetical protein